MWTTYEVSTARLTPKGRVKRTQVVEADGFRQERGTAAFADENGRAVAKIKHVVRICWQ